MKDRSSAEIVAHTEFRAGTPPGTPGCHVVIGEGAAGGAVSSTGLYTASSAPRACHVIATSQVDPTKYAVAEVTVGAAATTVGIPADPSRKQ